MNFRKPLLALAILCISAVPAFAAPTIGESAPDFTLTDTHGNSHSLSDYAGQIVVLEWINHECPFVRKHYESGNMQRLQAEITADGGAWLVINSSAPGLQGHTDAETANALIEQTGSRETARLLDHDGVVGRLYDAKVTPHMYVIDTDGILVYNGAIDSNPSADPATIEGATNYVREAVNALRAGEPVEVATTRPYGCTVKYATE